jgi:hypothetical protein
MILQNTDNLVADFRVIKDESTDKVFLLMLEYHKAFGRWPIAAMDVPKNSDLTTRNLAAPSLLGVQKAATYARHDFVCRGDL